MSWAQCFRALLLAVSWHTGMKQVGGQIPGGGQPGQWPVVSPAQSPAHDPANTCTPHSPPQSPRGSWSQPPAPICPPGLITKGMISAPNPSSCSPPTLLSLSAGGLTSFIQRKSKSQYRNSLESLTPKTQTSPHPQGPPPLPPEVGDHIPSCCPRPRPAPTSPSHPQSVQGEREEQFSSLYRFICPFKPLSPYNKHANLNLLFALSITLSFPSQSRGLPESAVDAGCLPAHTPVPAAVPMHSPRHCPCQGHSDLHTSSLHCSHYLLTGLFPL